jgi:hypothetical protein
MPPVSPSRAKLDRLEGKKNQGLFESAVARREFAQTKTLIANLDRIVQILNVDIASDDE